MTPYYDVQFVYRNGHCFHQEDQLISRIFRSRPKHFIGNGNAIISITPQNFHKTHFIVDHRTVYQIFCCCVPCTATVNFPFRDSSRSRHSPSRRNSSRHKSPYSRRRSSSPRRRRVIGFFFHRNQGCPGETREFWCCFFQTENWLKNRQGIYLHNRGKLVV